jgi:hypothetical protein
MLFERLLPLEVWDPELPDIRMSGKKFSVPYFKEYP